MDKQTKSNLLGAWSIHTFSANHSIISSIFRKQLKKTLKADHPNTRPGKPLELKGNKK